MKQLTLAIEGMMCDGCAASVREALAEVAGVESVDVTLKEKRPRVMVDKGTPEAALIAAVAAAGYEAAVL
ncbi:MAG: cation transporter [Gemmatimonadales bacterium]